MTYCIQDIEKDWERLGDEWIIKSITYGDRDDNGVEMRWGSGDDGYEDFRRACVLAMMRHIDPADERSTIVRKVSDAGGMEVWKLGICTARVDPLTGDYVITHPFRMRFSTKEGALDCALRFKNLVLRNRRGTAEEFFAKKGTAKARLKA